MIIYDYLDCISSEELPLGFKCVCVSVCLCAYQNIALLHLVTLFHCNVFDCF